MTNKNRKNKKKPICKPTTKFLYLISTCNGEMKESIDGLFPLKYSYLCFKLVQVSKKIKRRGKW